ncbi:MAG: hypothetical protein KDA58_08795 [Planctomycetaceae bacterium]|nr:hypothetical protein [Planctomycetaceae bacterium]
MTPAGASAIPQSPPEPPALRPDSPVDLPAPAPLETSTSGPEHSAASLRQATHIATKTTDAPHVVETAAFESRQTSPDDDVAPFPDGSALPASNQQPQSQPAVNGHTPQLDMAWTIQGGTERSASERAATPLETLDLPDDRSVRSRRATPAMGDFIIAPKPDHSALPEWARDRH